MPFSAGVTATPVVRVLVALLQIEGDGLDLLPEFQPFQPRRRDGVDSEQRAEDVAGDGAGAVAVAAVVHGEEDAATEVVREGQRAVDRDCERFLGNPALTDLLYDLRDRFRAAVEQRQRVFEATSGLFMAGLACQGFHRSGNGSTYPGAPHDLRDDRGQTTSGEIPRRVPVGDGCYLTPEIKDALCVSFVQPDRSHAHHAAASFAVVPRLGHRCLFT